MWVSVPQLLISGVLGALLSFAWSLRWAWPIHYQEEEAEQFLLHSQLADQAIRWGGGLGIGLNLILQVSWGEPGQTWADVLVSAASAAGTYVLLCALWEERAATTTQKDD